MADKKVYFTKPQRLTQLIGANTTVIVAGRRTGKHAPDYLKGNLRRLDTNLNKMRSVAGQPRERRLNVIKSFYVKFDRKIPALIDDFCRYYSNHLNRTVVFYFDATALGSNYAINDQDFRWWVIHDCSCQ